MYHHFWRNCTGFQKLRQSIRKFPPCAMMLSQILLRCTCLISFAFTSLPVRCVPLLTPASFGFQNERKSSKGSVLSPISVLSLGKKKKTPLLCTPCSNTIPLQNSAKNHTTPLSIQTRLLELLRVFSCSSYFSPVKLHAICICVSDRREEERQRGREGAHGAPMV